MMKYVVFGILALMFVSCTSCALGPDKEPAPVCDKESVQQLVIAAKKAGCKTYKIEMDQFLKSCTFTCYASER